MGVASWELAIGELTVLDMFGGGKLVGRGRW